MKKLTTQFVLDHIDEQFMIGINSLYWLGTPKSSMSNVLEEEEYPIFSEPFYRRYGSFSPLNPDLAIENIREERCSIDYIDACIRWGDFAIDVISFFHHSKCLFNVKTIIKDKFFDHYEYTAMVVDTQQEITAKKNLDERNDTRMLTFFEFRDYLWKWDYNIEQNMINENDDDNDDDNDDEPVAGPSWA